MKYNLLIIIPAKKNSTGLKNKNIRGFNGHPLFCYSLEAAKRIIEKKKITICSTNCLRIKKLSEKYGVQVPTLRPNKICQKTSRDIDFINHCIKYYYKKNIFFKFGLILRPTSPLRTASNLNKSYLFFKKNYKKFSSLKSVAVSKENPFKTWILKDNGELKNVAKIRINEFFNAPRQILPKTYKQTGSIEFFNINFKQKIKSMSGKKIKGFITNNSESVDIDNLSDFFYAESILKMNIRSFIIPIKK
jgi:CMP-N-acetylneuraminic acid synthetase